MTSKKARRRIVAYVESYDDIYYWRTVLSRFENEKRYFEVMLPSHRKLERGKKAVLFNFLDDKVGPDMIACVDADYDYLLQGATTVRYLMEGEILEDGKLTFGSGAPALMFVCFLAILITLIVKTVRNRKEAEE